MRGLAKIDRTTLPANGLGSYGWSEKSSGNLGSEVAFGMAMEGCLRKGHRTIAAENWPNRDLW